MVMMMAACGLRQILEIGHLAALRGCREVCCKLTELIRCRRIAVCLGRLGGALQVLRDLLGDLLILRWIRLLELLERAH